MDKHLILAEIERELLMRQRIYPKLVTQGKLSRENADHRILALQEAMRLITEHCLPDTNPVQGRLPI